MPTRLKLLDTSKQLPNHGSVDRQIALYGTRHLSNQELLTAALAGSHERRWKTASRLLVESEALRSFAHSGFEELRSKGLGRSEAARLLACLELGRRAGFESVSTEPLREPREAYLCVARHFEGSARERFVVVVLDVKNRARHVAVIFEGTVDSCPVDPREVFLPALRERGSAILLAHNHPSGDPSPSAEDLELTERLVEAGATLGIPVLDHIIVGRSHRQRPGFVSLAERGLMPVGQKGRRSFVASSL